VTDPTPDATDTTFDCTTTGGVDPATFSLKDQQTSDYGSDVFAGTYSVTEPDPSPEFVLTDLDRSASDLSHGSTRHRERGHSNGQLSAGIIVAPRWTEGDVRGRRRNGDTTDFPAILDAARRGEAWAFREIHGALAPAVAGFMRVHGAPEPDDLTSEVFVGVLRGVAAFQGDEDGFRAWVFTIAHRRLADDLRRRARRPATVRLLRDMDWPDPADDLDRALATARVRALCGTLGPGQRDVLLLRLIGRLTMSEIAAAVGRSPASVKALQRRGLAAVARLIEQDEVAL
jgi:RNA polymerase sigma factor (sigma-70 family)